MFYVDFHAVERHKLSIVEYSFPIFSVSDSNISETDFYVPLRLANGLVKHFRYALRYIVVMDFLSVQIGFELHDEPFFKLRHTVHKQLRNYSANEFLGRRKVVVNVCSKMQVRYKRW